MEFIFDWLLLLLGYLFFMSGVLFLSNVGELS